jgi:hypothetical protein
VDNSAAVSLAQHAGRFYATKHIELKYLVVREHQDLDFVKVAWVPGQYQLADVLTKPLYPAVFMTAVTRVGDGRECMYDNECRNIAMLNVLMTVVNARIGYMWESKEINVLIEYVINQI